MRPSEVRNAIRREHEYILAMVRRARRVGYGSLQELREQVRKLVIFLDGHITREERELLPLLDGAEGWTDAKFHELQRHHEQQRRDFAVLQEWASDSEQLTKGLTDQFTAFLDDIELDVDSENRHILTRAMLNDSPCLVGAVTGEFPQVNVSYNTTVS